MHGLRRIARKITLICGKGYFLSEEAARQICTVDTETLLRSVDFDPRIDLQHIGKSAHVIAVAVRHHYKIEPRKVDALRLGILCKNVGVVPRIEQDSLAIKFNERRISPILLHHGRVAEGVVDNGDLYVLGSVSSAGDAEIANCPANRSNPEKMTCPKWSFCTSSLIVRVVYDRLFVGN